MSRSRTRVCLDHGPRLDINFLFQQGYAREGFSAGPRIINWVDQFSGYSLSGLVSSNIGSLTEGVVRVEAGDLDQSVKIISVARHFGGRQWYFICPVTGDRVSVLWKPPGAIRFGGRNAWPRQVAYATQFGNWIDRAHCAKAKIIAKMTQDRDFERTTIPPRPKRMRAATYKRLSERFNRHQSKLDAGIESVAINFQAGD